MRKGVKLKHIKCITNNFDAVISCIEDNEIYID